MIFLQINLKLIVVSGKTAEFQFGPATTASDVAKYVFENWPEGLKRIFSFNFLII